jgi:anti-anti-sigma regulatory factor
MAMDPAQDFASGRGRASCASFGLGPKLAVTVDDQPRAQLLVLRGQIDDDADLASLGDSLHRPVVVDLEAVDFINSLGVRTWVVFLEGLRARGVAVALRRVSEAMIDQMNMIMEARCHATIESFYAPYACPACGLETRGLLEVGVYAPALRRHAPPRLPCPSCGGDMVFDDIPSRSLLFLEP